MNLSMKWLKEYVDIDASPREFAEAMTMSGSKVEGYEVEGEEIRNVVVGKVLKVERHPDADKLVVCSVDVGKSEPVQIVTGATNVTAGVIVPVALDGSTLPNGVKIKKGKLRGVESNGMLCSLGELNLTVNDFPYAIEDGIFLLQEPCEIGQDIQSAIGLNDIEVEFEITSNRPDCLSMIGLAREAAVTFNKPITLHTPEVKGNVGDISSMLKVSVLNTELCPRYSARVVKNVKIAPSPRWMRERLRACGVRPINNLVDITNYVMLEYGQPMHAFDYRFVKDSTITVRNAHDNETITTLDGAERKLSPEMLVICDSEKPMAVAGVMGGEYSGIMDDTNTVVFESAVFKGASIRTTAKKLGMRTESSGRFEKGLDPQNTFPALQRACELVELLGAGEVVGGIIDIDHTDKTPRTIALEPEWINRFLGIELSVDEMVRILKHLGFGCDGKTVTVPSYRTDVLHKADVAEEIARIYGYNNIPNTALTGTANGALTEEQKFRSTINELMRASGCNQVETYSFISPKYYDKIRLEKDSPLRSCVTIVNPLGEDTSVMRTTMLPSMMEVLARNYNNRNPSASLYELGTVYIKNSDESKLPQEDNVLCIGMYGGNVDFFTLKGIVEALATSIGTEELDFEAVTNNPTFHPGRCARVTVGGQTLGILGEVHPLTLENYGLETRAYLASLDVTTLFNARTALKTYMPMPRFPATTRDIALLCDDMLPVLTIEKAIRKAAGKILEKIELFDVYKGKQIEEGKKSIAFSLILRSSEGTLTDEQTDAAMKRILKAMEDLGATLRI
ncbi:phenylalanine--tRNA ligase subunit beta [Acetanaerobacterium elongatum]|uniref:Phenylalanine--tRNA ligase beta subunit n=1 Tax=Acetanaerobacterium elongatum TaxID=258515 RepID=A0A1H0G7D0_9FIRM|nr:phenylalanine--tRNA ligase subunit beta [Acetanaerobacterium elongatum]SDO02805.1 phenylalanyl-tRNA synthetase beta subunit [Acetanaerobacterium elongatum]